MYPIKLKIGMLDHTSNTSQNTVFQISVDVPLMLDWTSQQWNNCFINPPTNGSSGKILIADVHRAQQRDKKKLYSEEKDLISVLPGCATHVQQLDAVFNKLFGDVMRRLFEQHINENLVKYTK